MTSDPATIRKYSRRWFLAGAAGTGLLAAAGVAAATPSRGQLVVSSGNASAGVLRKLSGEWRPGELPVVEDLGEDTGDQYREMKRRATGGWGDVLLLDTIYVAEFAQAGLLAELPGDLVRTDLLPGPLATCRQPGDDRLFAVPFNTDVGVILSKKPIADDIVDLAKLVAGLPDDSRQFVGQLIGGNEAFLVNVLEHALAADERFLGMDGRLNNQVDIWTSALQPLADAIRDGKIFRATTEAATVAEFTRPGREFMRNWPYRRDNRSQVQDLAALSRGVLGGQNLAVVAGSSRHDESTDLIRHLTNAQSQRELVGSRLLPVDRAAYRDPTLVDAHPDLPVLLMGVEKARPRPIDAGYVALSTRFQERVGAYLDDAPANPFNQDTVNYVLNGG
ncbi:MULTISPECIES: extracellular solute-binding protein [Actinoplanes]|uniref:extracellular solute-binding protein n=1 Tax=Actinoplanes TaxID=1865 RepID=UPI0005F2E17B|nr:MULTISPECIES: extracellular solute-binding protein [Actinoplanes]GLY02100.1 hypothetical protein Acsp01_24790 [Actinoplanes sp. NBRC 101535]